MVQFRHPSIPQAQPTPNFHTQNTSSEIFTKQSCVPDKISQDLRLNFTNQHPPPILISLTPFWDCEHRKRKAETVCDGGCFGLEKDSFQSGHKYLYVSVDLSVPHMYNIRTTRKVDWGRSILEGLEPQTKTSKTFSPKVSWACTTHAQVSLLSLPLKLIPPKRRYLLANVVKLVVKKQGRAKLFQTPDYDPYLHFSYPWSFSPKNR